ncbi:PTS sugar transporter subunit IIB [Heyndrickxia coagulans]|jgi:fructoselysine and glucoselysine-specific PTS system IIB component|uniref:PTS sugar transporter subunit IIB n=1 Tax=Heyndrickxia TaxID=2837504 RepID=UPI0021B1EBF1|nr:PTS sugar transporter subunit IIB [Heyndrickxia coagulans]UXC22771.1 PTS sugar transporter subunit IIB [Heyndrickxia coagulans]
MIANLRVDHRLLHGQVAFAWTNYLGVNCILIANDAIANDDMRKNTLRLAKPSGVKLIMKPISESASAINQGLTDKYKMFIIVESVKDAYQLIKETGEAIKQLTLGGTKATTETINVSKAVNLKDEEFDYLDELTSMGVEVSLQQVPTDKKVKYSDIKRR